MKNKKNNVMGNMGKYIFAMTCFFLVSYGYSTNLNIPTPLLNNSKIIPGQPLTQEQKDGFSHINQVAQQYTQEEGQQQEQQQQQQQEEYASRSVVNTSSQPNWEIGSDLPKFMQTAMISWLKGSCDSQYKPLCQGMFGACATFAAAGALGYELAGSVRTISPLETLDLLQYQNNPKGYDLNTFTPIPSSKETWISGWFGETGEDILNVYLKHIPSYFLSDETQYAKFSKELLNQENDFYAKNKNPEELLSDVFSPISKYQVYLDMRNQYESFLTDPFNLIFNLIRNTEVFFPGVVVVAYQPNSILKISPKALTDHDFTDNTTFIKSALDHGQIVLIGFGCTSQIDQVGFPPDYYYFNKSNNSLVIGTPTNLGSPKTLKDIQTIVDSKMAQEISPGTNPYKADAWTSITQGNAKPVSGHEVFIVGYFVNKNASQTDVKDNQNIIFVVRNSWGLFGGDNGNFYMSGGFVDEYVDDCIALGSSVFSNGKINPLEPTKYE